MSKIAFMRASFGELTSDTDVMFNVLFNVGEAKEYMMNMICEPKAFEGFIHVMTNDCHYMVVEHTTMSNIFDDMLDWMIDEMLDWMIEEMDEPNPLMKAYVELLKTCGPEGDTNAPHGIIKINRTTFNTLNEYRPTFVKDQYDYNGVPLVIDDTLPDNVYKFD